MEFKEYYLGELCEIKSSKRIYAKDYVNKGIPFYRSKEIIEKSKGLDISQNLYIDNKKFEEIEEKHGIPETGDLLLTSVGTLGVPYIVKNEKFYFKDGNLTWFTNFKSLLNQYYLFYWFKSKEGKGEINRVTIGSTQKALTIKNLRYLKITLPDKKNQFKIINLIQKIENKLENNKQVIANLEELSQTLFKRWFVDFEFPDENGNPYKSSGGDMIDSEMGLIPRGWEVKSADEIYEITIGKTPPRKLTELFSEKEGIDWVSISDMKSEGMFIKSTKEKIIEEGVVDYKVKIVPKDSVLLSFKLTIGRVKLTNKELTTNEAIAHFYSSNINKLYTYLYLKNFEYGYLGNTSSIATAVNSKIIKKMPILVPEQKVLKRFINIAEPFMNRINIIQNENIELNQLRDTLLPKLMSGEIEIPDDIEVNEDELSI
ncbi:TPA: restriction endonuclease subunit S [Staphylococcus pseudintermedius]|nr:restriction endonuclease subunit S [Staphylococcus pseudintermedius]